MEAIARSREINKNYEAFLLTHQAQLEAFVKQQQNLAFGSPWDPHVQKLPLLGARAGSGIPIFEFPPAMYQKTMSTWPTEKAIKLSAVVIKKNDGSLDDRDDPLCGI